MDLELFRWKIPLVSLKKRGKHSFSTKVLGLKILNLHLTPTKYMLIQFDLLKTYEDKKERNLLIKFND